jgi:hypothetical protein
MSATKNIPLAQQPAYKEAMSKVVDIGRTLADTTVLLDRTRAALLEFQSKKTTNAPGAIERAMALVSGAQAGNPTNPPMAAEIQRLEEEQRSLRDGLMAANQAAEAVARELGRQIGLQEKARHIAAAKAVRDALLKLCEANKAERAVREDLERLGYDHYLPHAGFMSIGEVDDRNGSAAFYFMRESRHYVGE